MQLLSSVDKDNLPTLHSTEETEDPMVYVKFYNPMGDEAVFVTEYDGYDTVFGYRTVSGYDDVEGYFSLVELAGQRYVRDIYFEPCVLSSALADESRIMGADNSTDSATEESVKKTNKIKDIIEGIGWNGKVDTDKKKMTSDLKNSSDALFSIRGDLRSIGDRLKDNIELKLLGDGMFKGNAADKAFEAARRAKDSAYKIDYDIGVAAKDMEYLSRLLSHVE